MFPQKLLEECDRNKEKVEECQRYAKQYIDAIKVCPLAVPALSRLASPGVPGQAWGWGGAAQCQAALKGLGSSLGPLAGVLSIPLPGRITSCS